MATDKDLTSTPARPRRGTEKPTLKTIAELSGLAVPTVSRALNDAPDIGARTKSLVRRIADEIGYVPNRAGVRLRTGRTNVISLVLSTEHDMMNHTARLIAATAAGLRDTPFHLIVTPYFPTEDPMKPVRYVVENRTADAVILNQIEARDPRVAYLRAHDFAFATHGRTIWADSHPYVDFDNSAFGRLAASRLIAAGRRNLVLLAPPRAQNYAQDMIAGASAAAAAGGARFEVMESVTSDNPTQEIGAATTALLAARPEVDGLISASTAGAMAMVAALEEAGRNLGGDIDLAAKEAIAFLRLFRPQIFTVAENVAWAGNLLARAATQAVREPSAPPVQELEVPTEIDPPMPEKSAGIA